ncbi:MAG: ABC transporter ATP-binding protein [Spirochaetales bacterium]|jgi:ABC-type multidrug transport system fused ATPase/permease subunit|nr:ABC transporter ATP-binding protein [Spirochaetales bacterium]
MIGGHGGPGGLLHSFGDHESTEIKGKVLARLMKFVLPHWRKLLVAFFLMLLTTAAGLLIPYLTRIIIDDHITNKDWKGLVNTGIFLGVAMILAYISSSAQGYLLSIIGQKVLFSLRNRLFDHLQRLSVAYHDNHITGVTVSRVINDVAVINNLLSEGLITLIGDSILLIGTIVVMLLMDVRLALITFTIIPVMILATVIFGKKARVAFRDTREKVATLVGNLAENIGGMKVIQSYAQEGSSQDRFEENNRKNRNAHVRAMSLSFVFMPAINVLGIISSAIVLLAGGIMASKGMVTIGIIVAFMSYVSRFFIPIRELSQLFTTLQSATAGGERVLGILDMVPAVVDKPNAKVLEKVKGKINFDNVHFSYKNNIEVLHDINFDIEQGETIAIVGPTGAGKTSIINLVCRFYDASKGSVLIDGNNIKDIGIESLHRHMGFVSQDPFLFSGTIAENICYGADSANKEDMIRAAGHAEADSFINNLPDAYETKILEGGVNVSMGQRQLIGIARAILVDPAILIMDEATSSVDTVTEALIQKALDYLLSDRTAIVIAHRLTTIQGADRIYVLDDGRIIEQGTHGQLIKSQGVYRNLYEKQFILQK